MRAMEVHIESSMVIYKHGLHEDYMSTPGDGKGEEKLSGLFGVIVE